MKNTAELHELSLQSVREYLTAQPDIKDLSDGTRRYEEAIVRLIDQNNWKIESATEILQALIHTEDTKLAYAAFYALCTYFRRHLFKTELRDTIARHRAQFSGFVSFAFLELMSRKMTDPNDWSILEDAAALCETEVLKDNYGVAHCYAEYVAEACEKDKTRAAYYVSEHMELALKRANDAIRISHGYPKFYVTRARLQTLKAIYEGGENKEALFHQAQSDVDTAIAREKDHNKKVNYQLIGQQLQSEYYERVLASSINRQEERVNQKLQENNVKNLEFLSFFSAIIGLLLAGTQLLLGLTFAQGAALIVVLTGCLITAFGTLGFVLHGKSRFTINLLIVIIGLVIMAGGMLYGGIYAL